MRAWHALREPAVVILLLASVVHVVRRDLFDLLLFAGTAVLILVDAARSPAPADEEPAADLRQRFVAPSGDRGDSDGAVAGAPAVSRSPRGWVVAAGMTVFAALAAMPAPASLGAVLVLAAIGLAALALVLVRPPRGVAAETRRRRPDGKLTGWPVWAVIGVAACLWELASFIAQQVWPADEDTHPAVSDLVEPLLAGWFGRAVFLLLWGAAGWWLLRLWAGAEPGGGLRHGRFGTSGTAVPRTVAASTVESRTAEPGPVESGTADLRAADLHSRRKAGR